MQELIDQLSEDLDPDDPAGRDPEFIRRYGIPLTLALRRYFRADVEGLEHIPREGPVVVVANHNGGPILPDAWVALSYYWTQFSMDRPAHALVHDTLMRVPYLRNFVIKLGALRACRANAERVLAAGGVLLIYPGGDLDCFRSFSQRNRVDFFGRTGFIEMAIRHDAPLVPFVNAGGHETAITLHSSRALARWTGLERWLRMKTVPISLGLPWGLWVGPWPFVPLPAKFDFRVGKPYHFRPDAALEDDPEALGRAYLAIRNDMQDMLDDLARRRRPILG